MKRIDPHSDSVKRDAEAQTQAGLPVGKARDFEVESKSAAVRSRAGKELKDASGGNLCNAFDMSLVAVFASYTMIGEFIQIFLIIGLALRGIKLLHRGGSF